MTKQRKLILDIIRSSSEHMTVEQIFMKAKELMPSIAMGTVYRNLGLMLLDGEIRRIEMSHGPDCFDKSVLPHEHIVCISCGKLKDITVPDLMPFLEKQTGKKILSYDLNLHYKCDECRDE